VAGMALGTIFLVGQAKEYYKLLGERVTVGGDEFGSSFFTLTGFHGLHVMVGLVILLVLSGLLLRGMPLRKDSDLLSAVGIYWHFVDAVWLILFTLIYVLPYFFKL
jgi:heme/copper-type cytochrome/quinol oxidase subunit 3